MAQLVLNMISFETKYTFFKVQGNVFVTDNFDFRITDLLKGKGAFKNGRFQGKAGDLGGVNKCKKLVEEYFNNV